GARPVRMRSKTKPAENAPAPPKTKIALLAESAQADIDDEAEDKQRGGIQSLGRAFAILEEVARHREGIGLADLSKRVGLHNSTTFHLAKTMVSLGYIRQERTTSAIGSAAPCSRSPRARSTRSRWSMSPPPFLKTWRATAGE